MRYLSDKIVTPGIGSALRAPRPVGAQMTSAGSPAVRDITGRVRLGARSSPRPLDGPHPGDDPRELTVG